MSLDLFSVLRPSWEVAILDVQEEDLRCLHRGSIPRHVLEMLSEADCPEHSGERMPRPLPHRHLHFQVVLVEHHPRRLAPALELAAQQVLGLLVVLGVLMLLLALLLLVLELLLVGQMMIHQLEEDRSGNP